MHRLGSAGVPGLSPLDLPQVRQLPVIDVTNPAIEETAADILRIYQERFAAPPASSTG